MNKIASTFGYAAPVALVACPFCRELFEKAEATACPVCGVALTAFEKLAPSTDALGEDGIVPAPEHERMPLRDMSRGRGILLVQAAIGFTVFFLPWMHELQPTVRDYTGFQIARVLGWSWGALIAWTILVPTVLSRRTIAQLRGARVAAAFLCAIPAVTAVILLVRHPAPPSYVVHRFVYQWPIWIVLANSIIAIAVSLRLGGRVDDMRLRRGGAHGHVVH